MNDHVPIKLPEIHKPRAEVISLIDQAIGDDMEKEKDTITNSLESERQSLLGQLDAYERVREQMRRNGDWQAYHNCCEQLAHIGRLLWLTKNQNDT